MLKKWYNTDAAILSSMVGVTDEMVRSASNGEVTKNGDGDFEPGSIDGPDIFGELPDGETFMGHMELGMPIVNIHYLYGKRPVLPKLLRMDVKTIEKIAYFGSYVMVLKDKSVPYKGLVTYKEYAALDGSGREGLMTGAEAIEALLKEDGIQEKDEIILRTLPVLPIALRYFRTAEGVWYARSINFLYRRLMNRVLRLEKLTELEAPEIILVNEKRMLQEYADALISNGLRGEIVRTSAGMPALSLDEVYDSITSLMEKPFPSCPKGCPAVDPALWAAAKQELDACCRERERLAAETGDSFEDVACSPAENPDDPWDRLDARFEAAEGALADLLAPLMEEVMYEYFFDYADDWGRDLLRTAREGICHLAYYINQDAKSPIEEQAFPCIYKSMEYFAKKKTRIA